MMWFPSQVPGSVSSSLAQTSLRIRRSMVLRGPKGLRPMVLRGSPEGRGPMILRGGPEGSDPMVLRGGPEGPTWTVQVPMVLRECPEGPGPMILRGDPESPGPMVLRGSPEGPGPMIQVPVLQVSDWSGPGPLWICPVVRSGLGFLFDGTAINDGPSWQGWTVLRFPVPSPHRWPALSARSEDPPRSSPWSPPAQDART